MPEPVYITQPEDDEIIISLVEHQNVVHDTVRIGVQVQVEHDPNEQSEDQLRTNIRSALKQFLNVDWRFTRVNRERGQTRFEQVTVAAIARVSESENRMLFERASAASKQGLQLVNPVATYALPFDKVQQINRDLRIALFKQAQAECYQYNAAKEGSNYYRVALVEFADTPRMGDANQNRAGRAYAANTTSAYASSGAAGDEPDEGSPELGVTERFWVAAQVTLRANRE